MALEKQSLNNFLPDGFETEDKDGYKTNFSDDKISTGFQKDVADILSGPNLNNLIDKIGKNTNTTNNYIEYLNNMMINKTPIVDNNNKLNYTQIGLKKYSNTETFLLNDLVTDFIEEEVKIYRSLKNNNTNNPLTDTNYWEEISLGGGTWGEITGDITNQADLFETFVTNNSLVEVKAVFVDSYVNGTSGYNIWSNGYCEQWGYLIPATTVNTITLLKKYKDTDYNVTLGPSYTSNTSGTNVPFAAVSKTINTFSIYTASTNHRVYWKTSGYLAEGEY